MTKTDNESPADRIKREKAEKEAAAQEAAAQEAAAQEAAAQEAAKKAAEDAAAQKQEEQEEDPAIVAARKEKFARAEAFEKERQARIDALNAQTSERQSSQSLVNEAKGSTGMDKLHKIAQTLPSTTPNEHVLFGLGGVRFTAGDLRDAVGMRRT